MVVQGGGALAFSADAVDIPPWANLETTKGCGRKLTHSDGIEAQEGTSLVAPLRSTIFWT
jgi:hypothetical protein